MQTRLIKTKGGYTIIETMIAISLFLVVIMIGMDSLLNANLLHQKSQNMRSIMDNLSFVMEDMSKNIRTGSDYYCITGSDTLANVSVAKSGQSCWGVAFEPATGDPLNANDQWVYYISGGKIFKSTQGPYLASSFVQLSPDEVVLDIAPTVAGFSVLGAEPPLGNNQQPFVNIRLVGKITYKSVVTPFSLQTSISERLVDI